MRWGCGQTGLSEGKSMDDAFCCSQRGEEGGEVDANTPKKKKRQ